MSDNSIVTMEKHSISWSMALSILIIVAGFLAIVVPPAAGIAATILIGWLLVLCGAVHLGIGWHLRKVGGLTWAILLGAAYLFAGFYTLLHPVAGLAALTLILGAYLFAEAILEFALAWKLRPVGGSGWLMFDGVVTLIFSILIWTTWPSSSAWVIGTIVGVSLIFSGVSRLAMLSAARRAILRLA
ncbi:MAG TPA: DUF308 domain-containing protein [Terracidiphilus sp.]|nr:DUF308 domain-containing protein [Terracidiphilus sp.]